VIVRFGVWEGRKEAVRVAEASAVGLGDKGMDVIGFSGAGARRHAANNPPARIIRHIPMINVWLFCMICR
jgi:hypothetical protein